jgi:phosphoribosylformylglycinamidine synthase
MMKIGVIVFPGSNCDHDCYYALKHVSGQEVQFVWHKETNIAHFDALVLPGGFSYGDYLRTGAIARFSPVMEAVTDFAESGKLVIGICNGFQILCESGLLPGVLMRNESLRFVCKFVHLRVENDSTPFTNKCSRGDVLYIPVAHAEGNYFSDEDTVRILNENGQILFRYVDHEGNLTGDANPNGSLENIAGVMNGQGNVMGMMPHPDRCSEAILNSSDGVRIFDSMISWYNSRN